MHFFSGIQLNYLQTLLSFLVLLMTFFPVQCRVIHLCYQEKILISTLPNVSWHLRFSSVFLLLALCEHWTMLHYGRLFPSPTSSTHICWSVIIWILNKRSSKDLWSFYLYHSLFSSNLFCELYLLWLTRLSVPYLQFTVCTELHLGSFSLCCGLKSQGILILIAWHPIS